MLNQKNLNCIVGGPSSTQVVFAIVIFYVKIHMQGIFQQKLHHRAENFHMQIKDNGWILKMSHVLCMWKFYRRNL